MTDNLIARTNGLACQSGHMKAEQAAVKQHGMTVSMVATDAVVMAAPAFASTGTDASNISGRASAVDGLPAVENSLAEILRQTSLVQ